MHVASSIYVFRYASLRWRRAPCPRTTIGPRHSPTVGSYGTAVSDGRGTPVNLEPRPDRIGILHSQPQNLHHESHTPNPKPQSRYGSLRWRRVPCAAPLCRSLYLSHSLSLARALSRSCSLSPALALSLSPSLSLSLSLPLSLSASLVLSPTAGGTQGQDPECTGESNRHPRCRAI